MARSLTVQLDDTVIQTLPLEGPSLTVGRLPGNGLTLPHPLVSRHHATLHLEAGQLVLTDAGSTNGTFVGDERLLPDQPHVLAAGESFRIGPFVMTYQAAEAEEFAGEPEVIPAASDVAEAVEPAAAGGAQPVAPEEAPIPPVAEPQVSVPVTEEIVGAEEGPAAEPEVSAVVEQAAEPVAEQVAAPAPPEQAAGVATPAPAEPPVEPPAPAPALVGPPLTIAPGQPGGAVSAPPDGLVAAEQAAALAPAVPAVEPVALIGRMPGPARPTAIAPLPRGAASAYLNDLPAIYQDGDFLGRFLLIFESIWEPLEQRQDHLALYFDPRTCPAGFLPWLGSWLEFAVNPHWPEARLRRLLGEAMDLYRWRGTRYGLTRMIEICTGLTPVITEPPDAPFVFHVGLRLPPDTTVNQEVVEQLVQAHKPAHAGYVLDIRP